MASTSLSLCTAVIPLEMLTILVAFTLYKAIEIKYSHKRYFLPAMLQLHGYLFSLSLKSRDSEILLGPVIKQFSISSLQWRGLRLCLFATSMHGLKDKRIIYVRISAKIAKRELPATQSSPAVTGAARTPLFCSFQFRCGFACD